jgi:hypothetical protein
MAILMYEKAASLHQVKDAPFSGATKGTMPSCPQRFSKFFKNSDNFVETNRTSKKFFDENSNSKKSEDDNLCEMASRLFVQSS